MKIIVLLYLAAIFSLGFSLVLPDQDYILHPRFTASPYNQVNPDFEYPESVIVNKSQANITYLGQAYSGYITINPQTLSKIFYVIYPARGATESTATVNNTAPLILWLQGGPGCADGIGNYGEIGPYTIVNQSGIPTPQERDINWNDEYNLLFVDSPAGVGYSVSGNEIYTNAYGVAEYLQTFLIRFFQVYPSLLHNDFYVFGESYGGHYVPALATIIVQNISQNGINLKGIGVGNGCSDVYHQAASTSDLAFSLGLLDEKNRDQLASMELQAQKLADNGNLTGAQAVIEKVGDLVSDLDFNINQYNFEEYNPEVSDWAPYEAWLDLQTTKQAYGVDPNVTYQDCVDCDSDFMADFIVNYAINYTYLLSQDIVPDLRIMIYGGQNDMVCNNSGVQLFLQRLGWSGLAGYINSNKQILKDSQNNVIGNYKHYGRFTFVIIYAAGHMSPGDQPASARLVLEHFMQDLF